MGRGKLLIFTNRSGKYFAEQVIKHINKNSECNIELGNIKTIDFADGEIKPMIKNTVRGADVYLVQFCFDPQSKRSIHDNFFEMCSTADAFVRAGARHITLVLPYHPFLRQDHQRRREPITARLATDFITVSGTDAVITTEMHQEQIEGFYKKTKTDNLKTAKLLCKYIKKHYNLKNTIILAPDAGAAKKAEEFAKILNIDIAQGFKVRCNDKANVVEKLEIVGEVKGKNVIIPDDMIDTAGTCLRIYKKLKELGAKKISFCCTHALLNGPAIERLKQTNSEVITTDSIWHGEQFYKENKQIKIVSLAELYAKTIYNINKDESVSSLYN
jgi:ribose-phosphate pyrophosphokinase